MSLPFRIYIFFNNLTIFDRETSFLLLLVDDYGTRVNHPGINSFAACVESVPDSTRKHDFLEFQPKIASDVDHEHGGWVAVIF